MNDRRSFTFGLAWALLSVPHPGRAQPAGKPVRIGWLGNSRQATLGSGVQQAFITALRDRGWTEGKDVVFESRFAESHNERFADLVGELIALGVDLIVIAAGATAVLAAKQATATTPIVFVGVADPVKFGLVASYAHPGGNVTGLMQPLAHWGKWLELAREAVPGAPRIAVIANSTNIVYADYVQQNEIAAKQLGLQLQMIPVARVEDLPPAFESMKRAGAGALVVGPDGLFNANMSEIVERARAARLPVIAATRAAAEMGAMITWSPDLAHMFVQAAAYADKILRGAKPGDLPVEQPNKFELAINLKAAQALGITIPQPLLLRADRVIE